MLALLLALQTTLIAVASPSPHALKIAGIGRLLGENVAIGTSCHFVSGPLLFDAWEDFLQKAPPGKGELVEEALDAYHQSYSKTISRFDAHDEQLQKVCSAGDDVYVFTSSLSSQLMAKYRWDE
jgi:hypothetical protein